MSGAFDFEHLVELCRRTHEETRSSAVRPVDRSLVAFDVELAVRMVPRQVRARYIRLELRGSRADETGGHRMNADTGFPKLEPTRCSAPGSRGNRCTAQPISLPGFSDRFRVEIRQHGTSQRNRQRVSRISRRSADYRPRQGLSVDRREFRRRYRDGRKTSARDIDVVTFIHLPDDKDQATLNRHSPRLFDPTATIDDFGVDAYFVQLNTAVPESLVARSAYWYASGPIDEMDDGKDTCRSISPLPKTTQPTRCLMPCLVERGQP